MPNSVESWGGIEVNICVLLDRNFDAFFGWGSPRRGALASRNARLEDPSGSTFLPTPNFLKPPLTSKTLNCTSLSSPMGYIRKGHFSSEAFGFRHAFPSRTNPSAECLDKLVSIVEREAGAEASGFYFSFKWLRTGMSVLSKVILLSLLQILVIYIIVLTEIGKGDSLGILRPKRLCS